MSQEGVILTNDDASACKRSAVQLGYWDDPFIPYFVRQYERKAPEINRGYFARVRSIQLLVERFLMRFGADSQIVSLGAGFDTLYWRLKSAGLRFANFVETDFPQVTAKKLFYIQKQKGLLSAFQSDDGEVRLDRTSLHAPDYHLLPVDLARLTSVRTALSEAGLAAHRPTLFVAECVLVYIETSAVRTLLKYLAQTYRTAFFISYEMVGIDDRFGDILVNNVRGRGCELASVDACKSDDTQKQRFLDTGWDGARVRRMDEVLRLLPASEVGRIERLELLDEVDILLQLLQHYGIITAWRDADQRGLDLIDLG